MGKIKKEVKNFSASYCIVFWAVILYFIFGSYYITKFVTTDEQFWIYQRIPQYWHNLVKLNFKKTYINDKPGVSVALISGPGLIFDKRPSDHIIKEKDFDSYKTAYTGQLYSYFRIPIFIFNGLFIFYIFWLIKKITNHKIAAWSTVFIILSPVLLGISRIANPDALLWSFSFAAILSYLTLIKTEEKKFLYLSILFLGLSLLTKYVATILFPLFFIIILIHYLINFQSKFKENKKLSAIFFQKNIKNYFLVMAGSLAVFAFLMPASFLNPKLIWDGSFGFSGMEKISLPLFTVLAAIWLDAVFNKSLIVYWLANFIDKYKKIAIKIFFIITALLFATVLANWVFEQKIINVENIPIDARSSDNFVINTPLYKKIILEIFPLTFALTPISLLLMLFFWVKIIFHKNMEDILAENGLIMSIFMLMFFTGGIASGVLLNTRYSIMLFPVAGFLSACGAYLLFNNFIDKNKTKFYLISLLLISASVFSLWKIKPFYYNYASSLLPQKYIVSSAWGFGGYEASEYLNGLPEAEKLVVWTDYRGICEFFRGKCLRGEKKDLERFEIDYIILTRRGQSRMDNSILSKLENENLNPVWEFFIDNRPLNFIKIFKIEKQLWK